jgi:hypothetical protein
VVAAYNVVQGGFLAALLGVYGFMTLRPFWWGKLICVGVGSNWIVGAAVPAMVIGFYPILDCQIVAGIALFLVALVHQIADPRSDASSP